jgi:hypothetical protein
MDPYHAPQHLHGYLFTPGRRPPGQDRKLRSVRGSVSPTPRLIARLRDLLQPRRGDGERRAHSAPAKVAPPATDPVVLLDVDTGRDEPVPEDLHPVVQPSAARPDRAADRVPER